MAEMSLQDRINAVEDALEAALHPGADYCCLQTWTYDDYVVYQDEGSPAFYRRAYTIDANGAVTLGEAQPVEQTWVVAQPAMQNANVNGMLRAQMRM